MDISPNRLLYKALVNPTAYALLIANAFAIVTALQNHWGTSDIILLYWTQSVIIGVEMACRIILGDYNDEVQEMYRLGKSIARNKYMLAGLLLLHYGFFHLAYFVVINKEVVSFSFYKFLLTPGVVESLLAFAINTVFSLFYNAYKDGGTIKDLNATVYQPYLRIIPMHMVIMVSGLIGIVTGGVAGGALLLIFLILKTVADLLGQEWANT